MPPRPGRQQQGTRAAQAGMLAKQRARAGGNQDQPAHGASHAAQQRLGGDGLAQRQEVDE